MNPFNSIARQPVFRNIRPYVPLLGYALLALLVALSTSLAFEQISRSTEQGKLEELGAIADGKVDQITAWRNALIRRGQAIQSGSLLATEFERWQQDGQSAASRRRIQQLVADLRYGGGYRTNVLLLDRRGQLVFSSDNEDAMEAEDAQQALQALASRRVTVSDLHRNGPILIDLVVPLTAGGGNDERTVGVLMLQMDPHNFLYPLLESWPTHSASAETLLIRRDGEEVLYLNELRFRKNAALSLRLPQTPQMPVAMALRGTLSTTDGIDYRGVPVVAAMRGVPGTTWFVVSKVDRAELFAPLAQLQTWVMLTGFAFLVIGGGIFWIWYKQIQARHNLLQAQHDAAVEREMLVKHFEYLTKYASDIIIVADRSGRIVEANDRAMEVYGYSREELLQMKVADLRSPDEDPGAVRQQIKQLNERGELQYEAASRRKDGSTFFIEVNARVIDVHGVRYLQGIIRDITARKQAEEILRRNEALLSSSQRMARIGSWELDLTRNVLSWSAENFHIFEIEPDKFGGNPDTFFAIVHPDDRRRVEQAYFASVQNHTLYDVEHRLLLPDGRVKYVREWCETEYDAKGKPIRSVGTTQDITEQQLAQRRIQRLNKFYAAISKADEAIVRIRERDRLLDEICRIAVEYGQFKLAWIGVADTTTGRLQIVASGGTARGYLDFVQAAIAADQPEGIGPASMAFSENREVICNDFFAGPHMFTWQERAREFGLQASASCPIVVEEGAIGALTLYASEADYFDWELSRLLVDLANDISLALTNFQHESQRAQAEALLRQSAQEIADLYNHAPCGYHSLNADGVIVQINDTELQWLGYARDEVVGKLTVADLCYLKDRQKITGAGTGFDRERFARVAEIELIRKDGTLMPVIMNTTMIHDEHGNFSAIRSTLNDNTERRLMEEMRKEMEHVGRFNVAVEMASGMAHELSQPLTACNNYLDGCLRRMKEPAWDQEQIRKATQLAYKQSERAGKIINHLKAMVRRNESEREPVDVNVLAREALVFLENEVNDHDVAVHLDLSDVPPVMASRVEIVQTFLNLYKNAIESMRSGTRRELQVTTGLDDAGRVLVRVRDSGQGIAASIANHLFTPFHTSKPDGLGLGLSICHSFIEKHGGRIWVSSNSTAGAEFCFVLPTGMPHEKEYSAANGICG